MSIFYRMTIRARHQRSLRLGQCLARLSDVGQGMPGCMYVRVFSLPSDPLYWQVEGQWRCSAARDAFLCSEALRLVLAQAIDEGLFTHLECTVQSHQQAA